MCPNCGYRLAEEPAGKFAQTVLDEQKDKLDRLYTGWTDALLTNLCQEVTRANVALMTPDQQNLIQAFLDANALPKKMGCDSMQMVKETLTSLERVAVPSEDILMALTEGGMPCKVQELLSRFRNFGEVNRERVPTRCGLW